MQLSQLGLPCSIASSKVFAFCYQSFTTRLRIMQSYPMKLIVTLAIFEDFTVFLVARFFFYFHFPLLHECA
jgi:hypothetical protein